MTQLSLPGPISTRILNLRSKIVGIYAAFITVMSFTAAVWHQINPQTPDRLFLRMDLANGLFSLIALGLILRRQRLWGTRLLLVSLFILSTGAVLGLGMPPVFALSAYVVLLILSTIGGNYRDTAFLTMITTPMAIFLHIQGNSDPTLIFSTLVPVAAMIFVTGAVLAMIHATLERAIPQLESSHNRFQRLSHIDALTGLGNRRQFDESLAQALLHASPEEPVALALLDIDNLKGINDRISHPAGDAALRIVSGVLSESVRQSDVASRIGGDEFAVVLRLGGIKGAQQIKQRVLKRLRGTSFDELPGVDLSVSIGLAETSDPDTSPDDLLSSADRVLYSQRRKDR